jgi:murein DD-endopeptidase MepM/ murein hydrolase activator NlpD
VTTVAPGGVVRWPGHGIDRCRLDGHQWPPWEGACWFAVDLLQEAGPLEVERDRLGSSERLTITVADYPYAVQQLRVAPEMADPPADQTDRIRRETERVGAVWGLGGTPLFRLPLGPPLDPMPKARSFGSRRIFNGQPRDPHSGVDLSASPGTPVLAAERGRVAIANDHYFSGQSVFIDHGGDLVTMYFHLDRIDVRDGEAVERGQVIGTVGSTGRVTGPHLHFGVRWHGARVDPAVLLGDPARVPVIGSDHPG